ncbi:hypothetical protein BC938DRAFT_482658, partial [Jimgerdemannia flammicorona]
MFVYNEMDVKTNGHLYDSEVKVHVTCDKLTTLHSMTPSSNPELLFSFYAEMETGKNIRKHDRDDTNMTDMVSNAFDATNKVINDLLTFNGDENGDDAVEDNENIDDANDAKDGEYYGGDQQDENASVSCVLKEISQRDQPEKRKTSLVEKDGESEDNDQEPTKRVRLESVPSPVWEFEYEMPTWLPKVMKKHETAILTTDASHELASKPIYWRILDISEYNIVPDILSNADLSSLKLMFATALNEISWTSLEPAAERCLQALGKLNTKQLQSIGEM